MADGGAFAYSGTSVKVDGEEVDVPDFTKFEKKCDCCGCKITYIPAIEKYYLNQWECNFTKPSIIVFLLLLGYIFSLWSPWYTMKRFGNYAPILLDVIGILIFIIWSLSYFMSMFRSPGYLPWFWAVEKRESYTYEEHMAGIITNQDQFNFATENIRPERATLSKQARRIVLRADHICPWISNWVGLKNYRYFFMQLLWFLVSFIFFFIVVGFEIYDLAKNGWSTNVPRIGLIIIFIPVMLFFIFFMVVFVRHCRYLITNNTTINELKCEREDVYTNPYDIGCCENISQTIAPKEFCLCWFFPVPLPRESNGFDWPRNDVSTMEKLPESKNIDAPTSDKKDDGDTSVGIVFSSSSDKGYVVKRESTQSQSIFNISLQQNDAPEKDKISPPPAKSTKNEKNSDDHNDADILPPDSKSESDGNTKKDKPPAPSAEKQNTQDVEQPKISKTTDALKSSSSSSSVLVTTVVTIQEKTTDGIDDPFFVSITEGETKAPKSDKEPPTLPTKEKSNIRRSRKRSLPQKVGPPGQVHHEGDVVLFADGKYRRKVRKRVRVRTRKQTDGEQRKKLPSKYDKAAEAQVRSDPVRYFGSDE